MITYLEILIFSEGGSTRIFISITRFNRQYFNFKNTFKSSELNLEEKELIEFQF